MLDVLDVRDVTSIKNKIELFIKIIHFINGFNRLNYT